ncbi:MAG: hypothetical protein OXI95_08335 [bacterium]|nr:hypothetical protein [bacterium]
MKRVEPGRGEANPDRPVCRWRQREDGGKMYKIDPTRMDLVEEFRANPVGNHSADLQQMLNVVRAEPFPGKYVLICVKPHREWVLGRLSGVRGDPVEILEDRVFTRAEDAEWEVFRRRWKALTGECLD